MGSSKILGGCDVRSQEFVPVQSCHISCQLAMSQSESAYSAIADWHWTPSNTTEVAIWAPYGDVGTSQRRSGDVRTWGHCGRLTCAKCRSLYLTLAPGLASDIPLFPRLGARLRGDRVTSRGRWTRAGANTVPTGDPRRVLVRKARYNNWRRGSRTRRKDACWSRGTV